MANELSLDNNFYQLGGHYLREVCRLWAGVRYLKWQWQWQ
jgi:hypothetical protein